LFGKIGALGRFIASHEGAFAACRQDPRSEFWVSSRSVIRQKFQQLDLLARIQRFQQAFGHQ
jgi:hypothetical protein